MPQDEAQELLASVIAELDRDGQGYQPAEVAARMLDIAEAEQGLLSALTMRLAWLGALEMAKEYQPASAQLV